MGPPSEICEKTRNVYVYEQLGDQRDPSQDRLVDRSVVTEPYGRWSTKGVEPGHRYYADLLPFSFCQGDLSETLTAPPRPTDPPPNCATAPAAASECRYSFSGDIGADHSYACVKPYRILEYQDAGGCSGTYRTPDGRQADFQVAWGQGRFEVSKTDVFDLRAIDPTYRESRLWHPSEQLQAYKAAAGAHTMEPTRAKTAEPGGNLKVTFNGDRVEIEGYLYR